MMCKYSDVLSPELLLSKELTRKMLFNPHIVVYNHCTCVELFACYTCFGVWDMVKILAYGAQFAGCRQNTELRKWIAYHVMIVWILVS